MLGIAKIIHPVQTLRELKAYRIAAKGERAAIDAKKEAARKADSESIKRMIAGMDEFRKQQIENEKKALEGTGFKYPADCFLGAVERHLSKGQPPENCVEGIKQISIEA